MSDLTIRRGFSAICPPCRLEMLETRRLLSITLDGETLRLTGTAGNDEITLSRVAGTDNVVARINGESATFNLDQFEAVVVRGEAGDDFLRPSASGLTARGIFVLTQGGPGNDRIEGGSNDDVIFADGGRDSVFGNAGRDEIHGGDGDDRIEAGTGDDIVYGDGGLDSLLGGEGFDQMIEGGGGGFSDGGEFVYSGALLPRLTLDFDRNLVFRGTDQPDAVSVVRNNVGDLFVSVGGQMQKFFNGSFEGFRFIGNGGDDDLRLGTQLPIPATLNGGAGDDTLVGGAADDLLVGGSGNDSLDGSAGDDEMYGQGGNDTLLGQGGNDRLFANDNARDSLDGGSENDTATFDSLDVVTNVDTPA